MTSILSAPRRTALGRFFSNFSLLKSTTLALLTAASLSASSHAADLPDAIFFDPPEGMLEDSEGRFFAKLSALAMHRAENPNVFLAGENVAADRNSINSLSGSQLSNGWTPGVELIVGVNDIMENTDGRWNFWGRGQLIGLWSDDRQISGGGEPINPFVIDYATQAALFSHGITNTGTMDVNYSSAMWSVDANIEYELDNQTTRLIGGLRYIRLEEELNLHAGAEDFCFLDFLGRCATGTLGTPVDFDVNNRAVNNMFGLQMGIDQKIVEDNNGFFLNLQALVGLAANNIKTSAVGTIPFASGFPRGWFEYQVEGKADDLKIGLFAEGNISSKYEINDAISIELGYRALWLQKTAGVVDAIANLDPTGTSTCTGFGCGSVPSGTGGGRVETDQMLLHGGRLGLKVRF